MAGLWDKSNTQIHDQNGKPLIGAKAYFFQAGTSTPITVYQAYSLGDVNKLPNPVQTNGFGFFPSVYLDEAIGFYRVRMTTAGGVIIYDVDGIPIIGPTGGGGGGAPNPVDPNSVSITGDIKARYGIGLLPGWVRGNGRTIGSATSGASERANSDAQALFEFLWNGDPSLDVLGGRGATAAADWNANKQISLPDFRGSALIGIDTMGNIAAGKVALATSLGWSGGAEKHLLSVAEMPSHTHGVNDPGHNHSFTTPRQINDADRGTQSSLFSIDDISTGLTSVSATGITIAASGGGGLHNNLQPSVATTIYIRL